MSLYKEGYHILRRRLKVLVKRNRKLEKEVSHLNNLLRLHEDMIFASL
jgi:hypothetical protein